MFNYEDHYEDGVLRMRVRVREPIVISYPCPDDIEESDWKGLHPAAQALICMCNRKPLYSFWKR